MNRKALLMVSMVFLLGVAVGAMGFYIASHNVVAGQSGSNSQRIVERLTTELNLTPEQQQQVASVLEETKKSYDSILEPIRPQLDSARQQGRRKIRAILTAEQLPKFEEHLRKIDEERAKRK